MQGEVLLAVGIEDVIPVIIGIIVAIMAVLAQVIRGDQKPAAPARPNGPQPAARPRPAAQKVDDEIAEFLRRAAQRRGGQPVNVPQPGQQRGAPQGETPVEAVVVDESVAAGGLGAALAAREAAVRAGKLETAVAQADDRLEARLKDRFGAVGEPNAAAPRQEITPSVEGSPEVSVGAMSASNVALVSLLMNPDSIRQAIILSEILRPPEERW